MKKKTLRRTPGRVPLDENLDAEILDLLNDPRSLAELANVVEHYGEPDGNHMALYRRLIRVLSAVPKPDAAALGDAWSRLAESLRPVNTRAECAPSLTAFKTALEWFGRIPEKERFADTDYLRTLLMLTSWRVDFDPASALEYARLYLCAYDSSGVDCETGEVLHFAALACDALGKTEEAARLRERLNELDGKEKARRADVQPVPRAAPAQSGPGKSPGIAAESLLSIAPRGDDPDMMLFAFYPSRGDWRRALDDARRERPDRAYMIRPWEDRAIFLDEDAEIVGKLLHVLPLDIAVGGKFTKAVVVPYTKNARMESVNLLHRACRVPVTLDFWTPRKGANQGDGAA